MGRSASTTIRESFIYRRERNQAMGKILAAARRQQGKSLLECATYIGTSRRRYTAIEHGETPLQVVELELLLDYLNIPVAQICPTLGTVQGRQVVVTLAPGEVVNVLVKPSVFNNDHHPV